MVLFKKNVDLDQTVSDFLAKEQARKSKIHSLISELELSSKETTRKIAELNDSLVECQMNDDPAGVDRIRSEVRELRLSLAGYEDEIAGYRRQLEISPLRDKEIAHIREVALKAFKESHVITEKLLLEKQKLEQQKKELEQKIKQLNDEHTRVLNNQEVHVLRRILHFIEPRMKEPKYSVDAESFLRGWIHGQSREEYFESNLRY